MHYTPKQSYEFAFKKVADPIVERRNCAVSGTEFPITERDMRYYEKISPIFAGEKFPVKLPELCPEERHMRRVGRRNMRRFHKDTCDLTGRFMVSLYNDQKPYKVYHQEAWRSDQRDPMDYGKDYDFSRPFFQQFEEQMLAVPRMAMVNTNTQNSEYANYITDAKNCYMASVLYFGCEYVAYSTRIMHGKHVVDCYEVRTGELCYECTSSGNLFRCVYAHECYDCQYINFSVGLINCNNCLYCYNLSGKSYCVANIQYSKEVYLTKIKELQAQTDYRNESKKIFENILITRPLRATWSVNCENSIGNNIFNGQNAFFVFGGQHYQEVKYVLNSEGGSNNMDMTGGACELCFESTNVGLEGTSNFIGCVSCLRTHHSYYCDNCYDCSYCFGCIGLRHKSYCILNKQYSKEDREQQMNAIARHMTSTREWGDFFPLQDNTFAYNETYAHDMFPLTKKEALSRGYKWFEEEKHVFTGNAIVAKSIELYNPTIVGEAQALANKQELLHGVIVCEQTGRGFRIISTELTICQILGIQLPRLHPDVRYTQRFARMSGKTLYVKTCAKSGEDILTVFGESYKNPVYSEEVWDKEVYG